MEKNVKKNCSMSANKRTISREQAIEIEACSQELIEKARKMNLIENFEDTYETMSLEEFGTSVIIPFVQETIGQEKKDFLLEISKAFIHKLADIHAINVIDEGLADEEYLMKIINEKNSVDFIWKKALIALCDLNNIKISPHEIAEKLFHDAKRNGEFWKLLAKYECLKDDDSSDVFLYFRDYVTKNAKTRGKTAYEAGEILMRLVAQDGKCIYAHQNYVESASSTYIVDVALDWLSKTNFPRHLLSIFRELTSEILPY